MGMPDDPGMKDGAAAKGHPIDQTVPHGAVGFRPVSNVLKYRKLVSYHEHLRNHLTALRHSGLDPESSCFLNVTPLDAGSGSGMTG